MPSKKSRIGVRANDKLTASDRKLRSIVSKTPRTIDAPDAQWLQTFRRLLKRWYKQQQRPLPWRQNNDAYRIWISEIMLQQTQVATVLEYYSRFLQRFPTVNALADADAQDVLKLWAGLGYYRRARSLHHAARQVVADFGGCFPQDVDALQSLAGIGRYTAGAIASFAYDQRAPILEANTQRLFSRLLALKQPLHQSQTQRRLWQFAEAILPPRSGSGQINQSVMELGSLICTPEAPNCTACPVANLCAAYREGIQQQIPVPKPKPSFQSVIHVGIVIRDVRGRVLLHRNPPGKWWQDLWDLPWVQWPVQQRWNPSLKLLGVIREEFQQQLSLDCQPQRVCQLIRHAVTRYKIHYHCVAAKLNGLPVSTGNSSWRWARLDQLPPMTTRFHRIKWDAISDN